MDVCVPTEDGVNERNAGFRASLVRMFLPYVLTHPWKPLPMVRKQVPKRSTRVRLKAR